MKKLAALTLVLASASAWAQVSCNTVGTMTFCSDGSSAQRIGNMVFGNDGSSAQRIGNTTFINPPPAMPPPMPIQPIQPFAPLAPLAPLGPPQPRCTVGPFGRMTCF